MVQYSELLLSLRVLSHMLRHGRSLSQLQDMHMVMYIRHLRWRFLRLVRQSLYLLTRLVRRQESLFITSRVQEFYRECTTSMILLRALQEAALILRLRQSRISGLQLRIQSLKSMTIHLRTYSRKYSMLSIRLSSRNLA